MKTEGPVGLIFTRPSVVTYLLLRHNLHRARLHMLGLGQIQRQYAIGIAGLGAFWIDRGREGEGLLELSILLQCRKIEKLIRM